MENTTENTIKNTTENTIKNTTEKLSGNKISNTKNTA